MAISRLVVSELHYNYYLLFWSKEAVAAHFIKADPIPGAE